MGIFLIMFVYRLTELSPIILPAEQIVSKIMSEVLETKMSASHKAVINIYIDEFKILNHLKNLRKIFLYEAGYLMDSFFTKLFPQVCADLFLKYIFSFIDYVKFGLD